MATISKSGAGERRGYTAADVIEGALSILVSDALNGITPNDSVHYQRMEAAGLPRHEAEAEVRSLVKQIRARALQLAGDRAHVVMDRAA